MLILKGMMASRVSLLQNDFASGLPSPFAFLGLVEKIGRLTGAEPWSLGVMPIIHGLKSSHGRTKGYMTKDGSNIKTIEIPEDIRGNVSFSLIVDGADQYIDVQAFADVMGTSRLAGGAIFGNVNFLEHAEHSKLLSFAPRGRALIPMTGQPIWAGRGNPEEWFDAVMPFDRTKKPGWRVPVAVRYDLLEDPVMGRKGTRDASIPHAFAEPVAGVAELISPRSDALKDLSHEDFANLMWKYTPAAGSVAAHKFYITKGEQQ